MREPFPDLMWSGIYLLCDSHLSAFKHFDAVVKLLSLPVFISCDDLKMAPRALHLQREGEAPCYILSKRRRVIARRGVVSQHLNPVEIDSFAGAGSLAFERQKVFARFAVFAGHGSNLLPADDLSL